MMEEQRKTIRVLISGMNCPPAMACSTIKSSICRKAKTALAANLTQDQIRQAVDRADKWIQAQ